MIATSTAYAAVCAEHWVLDSGNSERLIMALLRTLHGLDRLQGVHVLKVKVRTPSRRKSSDGTQNVHPYCA